MRVFGIHSPIIEEGQQLLPLFFELLGGKDLENVVLVITSKVLALSQRRVVSYASEEEFFAHVERKADQVLQKQEKFWLTEVSGMLLPNAGIDKSNAEPGKAILLPEKPEIAARTFWQSLRVHFGIKNFGVLVIDSRVLPFRRGISGIALGWAGFRGVEDLRGETDLHGRKLEVSQLATADNLASMSQQYMRQGDDRVPFVLVEDAAVVFTEEEESPKKAQIPREEDLFFGLSS